MNYFELFNITPHIFIDTTTLKKTFFALSRKFHPDTLGSALQTENTLLNAAEINNAWETFKSTDKTIHYILTINNQIADNEKYPIDNTFLMEIMELKEQLMDAEMDENNHLLIKVKTEMDAIENKLNSSLVQINNQFLSTGITALNLQLLKDHYYKLKYIKKNNH